MGIKKYGPLVKMGILTRPKWYLLSLSFNRKYLKMEGISFWRFLWGCDIFICKLPFLKSVILLNIIVCIILYLLFKV